jgi:DNA-binding transcriptional LysR family regulator
MRPSRIHRYVRHGTLPQLAVFEASARLRSFTRAAEELHLAQPTVSAQIRKLTETVGLPLFEQIGKQIYLTDTGRRTYAHCQEIFRTLESLDDVLTDLRGVETGRLCVAVTTTAECFVPRLLAGFARRHPGIDVSLRIHNRRALIERMANNEDDSMCSRIRLRIAKSYGRRFSRTPWWCSRAPPTPWCANGASRLRAWCASRS